MSELNIDPRIAEQMRQSRVMQAYRDLFGADEKTRTEIQRIVWEDLKVCGYLHEPVFVPDKAGALCPMRAAFADGRRSIFLYIRSNVEFAPNVAQQQSNP